MGNKPLYISILLLLAINYRMFAQEHNVRGVIMQVYESEHNKAPNIVNAVIKIVNKTDQNFSGYVVLEDIEGLKSISGTKWAVSLFSSDSMFVSSKFLIEPSAKAGRQSIIYNLFNNNNDLMASGTVDINVPGKEALSFSVESANIFIANPNDSVRIKASVENQGNKSQDVSIVFVIPGASGNKIFTEKSVTLNPSERRLVELSFLPSPGLLNQQQFYVNVYASREKDKQIFGNTSVVVWNVASEQRYQDNPPYGSDYYDGYSPNSMTVSYLQARSSSYVLQARGSGSVDLPVGYLDFKGTAYKINNSENLYMTNTLVSYRFLGNEITVGNINEGFDITMYGRGAKFSLTNKENSRKLTAGFIENEFNLVSPSKLLSNSYGAYLTLQSGMKNIYKGVNTSIIYQYNDFENSQNYLLSNEVRFILGNDWQFKVRTAEAISYIEKIDRDKLSGATELMYRGKLFDVTMFGNIYWSSAYYPGNRRGTTSITQTFERPLKSRITLKSNLLYFKIAPKSYNYPITSYSRNLKADIGIYLPKAGLIRPAFIYQFQSEKANSQNLFFNTNRDKYVSLYSNRLIEQLVWNSKNLKHLVVFSLENGFAKYSGKKNPDFQFRISNSYIYKWLNFTATYQSGAYYLSEYVFFTDRREKYKRFILSTSANKESSNGKFRINIGGNFMYDHISGETPSIFSNFAYSPSKRYTFYTNATWYQYRISGMSNKILNFEVGCTINFSTQKPSGGKKSKLLASVFYDNNSNKIFDKGDTPASGYQVIIDKKPFMTNENGEITYKNVPFGEYQVKPASQNGWFYSGAKFDIDKYKTNISIPLQQTGTVIGHIEFSYNRKKSLDSKLSMSGIKISIKSLQNNTNQDVITDNDGKFTTFLPPGDYVAEVVQSSLSKEMIPVNSTAEFVVKSSTITNLPGFTIQIKQKTINLKQFFQ